jgi:hypothetical protein
MVFSAARSTSKLSTKLPRPTKFDLIITNDCQGALGLTIPEPFLLCADEVIE